MKKNTDCYLNEPNTIIDTYLSVSTKYENNICFTSMSVIIYQALLRLPSLRSLNALLSVSAIDPNLLENISISGSSLQ